MQEDKETGEVHMLSFAAANNRCWYVVIGFPFLERNAFLNVLELLVLKA